ncbi:MAG: hypothetical protein ACRCXM_08145 [Beijerinckiaceae bacterium]
MAVFTVIIAALALGHILPVSAQTAQSEHNIVMREVRAGEQRPVWMMWDLDEQCQTYRGFSAEIHRMPQHGTARLAKVEQQVSPRWFNARLPPQFRMRVRQCLGQVVPVIMVYFAPHANFTGRDRMQIGTINPRTNFRRTVDIEIIVR